MILLISGIRIYPGYLEVFHLSTKVMSMRLFRILSDVKNYIRIKHESSLIEQLMISLLMSCYQPVIS